MTNPIPEDAIEAAAKAIWVNDQKDQAWALRVVDDAFSPADDWTEECMGYWYRAEAALTAARPHMEAEVRGQVAAEIRDSVDDMGDPRTYLQDVLAKADAATGGPWEVYSVPATRKEAGYVAVEASETEVRIARYEGGYFDGAHIASSRTSVPVMARALLAVLDLHKRGEARGIPVCGQCYAMDDDADMESANWPCETYRTITTELAKEDRA